MREAPLSEQNILNPTTDSLLNPDWPWSGEPDDLSLRYVPRGARAYSRPLSPSPHKFSLSWTRQRSVADQIRQWYWQYQNSYFTLADYTRNRYFTGNFASRPQIQQTLDSLCTIAADFEEVVGAPMYQYPSNWGVDSYILEETDVDANPLVKISVGATLDANAAHSSGKAYLLTDVLSGAEWSYDGYGFRLISAKGPAYGILNLFLDGVQITTVDLYAAALTNAAVLSTQQGVAFGRHRVGVFFSGNKNAASTNTQVIADAIEVMI